MRESHLIKPQHRKRFFGRVLSKFQYFSRPILSERQAIAPLLGPIFAGILGLVAFAGKFFCLFFEIVHSTICLLEFEIHECTCTFLMYNLPQCRKTVMTPLRNIQGTRNIKGYFFMKI